MTQRTLKRDYVSNEYSDMPEHIKIALEPDSEEKLEEIRKIISDNQPIIKSINIDPSQIFDAGYSEFAACDFRIGVEYITVYEKHDWWLVVQCKYDSSTCAEYSLKTEEEGE
ncbi:MAG: hypothetical protein O2970_11015 [Proteobacteria bacterium]|nr:hypothetical protein [Pseudomonadota bacterium]